MGETIGGAVLGGAIGGPLGSTIGGAVGGPKVGNALFPGANRFYVDPGPRPDYLGFTYLRGDSGLIDKPALNANIDLNTQALEALRARGLAAPGSSPWEQMSLQRQGLEEQNALQNATQTGASRAAEARAALAARTGLSSGAMERSGRNSMRDILAAQQDVASQGRLNRSDIGIEGERQRLATLSQLPGMEISTAEAKLRPQEFNITNALNQKAQEEAAKLAQYQEQMRAWAAANQANAIGAAGPSNKGLFGTGLFSS